MSAIFFLIFAIGAQTCPEDRDEAAEKYFNYGRLLTTASGLMEEPSLSTVTANILLTMYLLAASRRNAAFVTLGTAVRAALALGIHRYEINELFGTSEFTTRERLWKVLRVLDLFMSASLGRPPSTHETRNTKAGTNYSASNDLCAIFENILTDVYSGRTVTPEVLGRISGDHREWAQKFTTGLAVDDIRPGEFIGTHQGRRIPNVGLLHLKEAYYWTIMLLTRPFLVESVNSHFSHSVGDSGLAKDTAPTPTSPSNYILAQACVDSAIRTVDLLHGLMSAEEVPKRLPFVVNSLFVAALVLGLAQFANKDQSFPLEKSFARARDLLGRFGRNDTVAKRNHAVVEKLRAACNLYLEQRTRRKMEKNSQRIGGLFGTVHDDYLSKAPPPGRATPPPAPREAVAPSLDLSLPFNNTEFAISSSSTIPEGAPHPIELGAGSLEIELLPDFAAMTDLSIPMSPSTFLFEKYDGIDSLFSTVDSSLFASKESGFLGEGFTR